MQLLKKNNKLKYFWVENYNDEQREFFLGLGFTEKVSMFAGEVMDKTMHFNGSAFIKTWNDNEWKRISSAVKKEYGKCKPRKLTFAEMV